MTGKKSSESRRKLLKSIAAGSGAIVAGKSLPESWTRPVVDSVMLPTHAQTSLCGALTITEILDYNNQPLQCGDVAESIRTFTFSFNVSPVPPAGTEISLTDSNCASVIDSPTTTPVLVDGSGNATMDVYNGSCQIPSITFEFSTTCGSTVNCSYVRRI